jgi:hypothetical protein
MRSRLGHLDREPVDLHDGVPVYAGTEGACDELGPEVYAQDGNGAFYCLTEKVFLEWSHGRIASLFTLIGPPSAMMRSSPLGTIGKRLCRRYAGTPGLQPGRDTSEPFEGGVLEHMDVYLAFAPFQAVAFCFVPSCLLDAYWEASINKHLRSAILRRRLFPTTCLVGEGGIEPPTPCL